MYSMSVTLEYAGSSASSGLYLIPFLLAILTWMMETGMPLSAIHVSYLLFDVPLILGGDFFIFNL